MNQEDIPTRNKSLNQDELQVSGEFRRGDTHPLFPSLGYYKFDKKHQKQVWMTKERLEVYKNRKSAEARAKYRSDPEYARELIKRQLRYAKENPQYRAERAAKRRAQMRDGLAQLTEEDKKLIAQYYAYSARLSKKLQMPFHVDHIVPLSKGGKHIPSNLQVVPAKWNWSKNNRNNLRWQ